MAPQDIDDRVTPGAPRSHNFLLSLSIVLLVVAAFILWPYRAAIVFALLVGYLLHPAYRWLKPRVRWGSLAAGLLLLATAVVLVAPLFLLGTILLEDVLGLARSLTGGIPLKGTVRGLFETLGVPTRYVDPLISRTADQVLGFLQGALVPALTRFVDFVIGLIVFFVLLYFFLTDGGDFVEYTKRILPLDAPRATRLLDAMGERARAVLLGSFFIALVQGVLAGLGWWILGLPAPILWATVMVLLEIVPIVGAFLILLPAAVWAFAQGDVVAGVGLIVLNFVLVGLVDDVLRPYVIGRQSEIHPAIVLLGIVGGLAVFGLAGIILGPILLSLVNPVLEAWAEPYHGYLADGSSGGESD